VSAAGPGLRAEAQCSCASRQARRVRQVRGRGRNRDLVPVGLGAQARQRMRAVRKTKNARSHQGGGFKMWVNKACLHMRGTSDAQAVRCMGAARVA